MSQKQRHHQIGKASIMTPTAIAATPTKLRTGEWGCTAPQGVRPGDIVTITTRSGKSWDARIESIVWNNGSVAICATSKIEAAPSAHHAGRVDHCKGIEASIRAARPPRRVCRECGLPECDAARSPGMSCSL